MPEIVPDDGAKDPIVRRTGDQQPTTCTEENVDFMGGARGVHFHHSANKHCGGGSRFLMRSYSEDPNAKRNCAGFTHPMKLAGTERVEETSQEEEEGKNSREIQTQTSRQDPPEKEKLIDEDGNKTCGEDDVDAECGKLHHRSSIGERRCKCMTIAAFVVVFLILGICIVTFFVLRSHKHNNSEATVEALRKQILPNDTRKHQCPTFTAQLQKEKIADSAVGEIQLPWQSEKAEDKTPFVQQLDNSQFTIQKTSWYTVHVLVHIDTNSWVDPDDQGPYTANLCIGIKSADKDIDPHCSKLTIGTRNILPLNLHWSRVHIMENDVIYTHIYVMNKKVISDGTLQLHPEEC